MQFLTFHRRMDRWVKSS
ncbi:MAG: hypothetical protein ACK5RE_20020 [Pseudanabaena sp.]